MTTNHPPCDSERGAAMIEFAISAIVLFTLVFGTIAVAMGFYTYEVINQYARDASRYAIVHGAGCNSPANGNCSIGVGDNYYTPQGGGTETPGTAPADTRLTSYLNNELFPGINGTQLAVTTAYAPGPGAASCSIANCNGAGDQVTVTVSYNYLYAVPFIPSRTFTMYGSSTMIISQ